MQKTIRTGCVVTYIDKTVGWMAKKVSVAVVDASFCRHSFLSLFPLFVMQSNADVIKLKLCCVLEILYLFENERMRSVCIFVTFKFIDLFFSNVATPSVPYLPHKDQ